MRIVHLVAASSIIVLATVFTARAANTPVFRYSFPASWNGTGLDVIDQSPAGNNGNIDGTLALSNTVPPGAAAGTQSVTTSAGAMVTNASQLLTNPTVAAAGGYQYDLAFMWDGTDSSSFGHVEKIIDYAGTESLQMTTSAGSAALQMRFDDSVNAVSTPIQPNLWYLVSAKFEGTTIDGTGNIPGMATLTVTDLTDAGSPVVTGPTAATKTTQGDTLNRPIGIGELGSNFGYLVGFHGNIYNPSVTLVPEPACMGLLCAAIPLLARRRGAPA